MMFMQVDLPETVADWDTCSTVPAMVPAKPVMKTVAV